MNFVQRTLTKWFSPPSVKAQEALLVFVSNAEDCSEAEMSLEHQFEYFRQSRSVFERWAEDYKGGAQTITPHLCLLGFPLEGSRFDPFEGPYQILKGMQSVLRGICVMRDMESLGNQDLTFISLHVGQVISGEVGQRYLFIGECVNVVTKANDLAKSSCSPIVFTQAVLDRFPHMPIERECGTILSKSSGLIKVYRMKERLKW